MDTHTQYTGAREGRLWVGHRQKHDAPQWAQHRPHGRYTTAQRPHQKLQSDMFILCPLKGGVDEAIFTTLQVVFFHLFLLKPILIGELSSEDDIFRGEGGGNSRSFGRFGPLMCSTEETSFQCLRYSQQTVLSRRKRSRLVRCLGRQGFLFPCDAEKIKKSIASGTWGRWHQEDSGMVWRITQNV